MPKKKNSTSSKTRVHHHSSNDNHDSNSKSLSNRITVDLTESHNHQNDTKPAPKSQNVENDKNRGGGSEGSDASGEGNKGKEKLVKKYAPKGKRYQDIKKERISDARDKDERPGKVLFRPHSITVKRYPEIPTPAYRPAKVHSGYFQMAKDYSKSYRRCSSLSTWMPSLSLVPDSETSSSTSDSSFLDPSVLGTAEPNPSGHVTEAWQTTTFNEHYRHRTLKSPGSFMFQEQNGHMYRSCERSRYDQRYGRPHTAPSSLERSLEKQRAQLSQKRHQSYQHSELIQKRKEAMLIMQRRHAERRHDLQKALSVTSLRTPSSLKVGGWVGGLVA